MDNVTKLIGLIRHQGSAYLRALMRQSVGSYKAAHEIVRQHSEHFGITNLTDHEIDCAIGSECNGGFEVEWPSD